MTQQTNAIGKTDSGDGGVSDEQCSNNEYTAAASEFMKKTSLEEMHEIAEIARRKKLEAPPKWVFPEGGIQP